MALLDWIIVVVFLLGVTAIGMVFAKRAGKNMDEYFVGGRTIPWWLAGTSMLATSFASDTPLHTTRMIREQGLGGAWFYWGGIPAAVVIAFFFSRLWRRTGVTTDNELIELRYGGKPAAVLRGGLAIFKSLFLEILTMAWITLGMTKIVGAIMGLPPTVDVPALGAVRSDVVVLVILLVVTVGFSAASGLWGVVSTELAEFATAMTGAIVLAVVAVHKVGGISGLKEGLAKVAPMGDKTLSFWPTLSSDGVTMLALSVYLGVQWWANAFVDGSGYRAQRLLACKDERHAIAAGIWSLTVTWLVRSWPWYLAALASLVLYPQVTDAETVYPTMVAQLLPIGLKGIMVASFLSAFMGTMESHYNLCASYLVNDVYKRFMVRGRDGDHYVRASRWGTILVAALAGLVTLLLPSVLGAFRFKMELMAGLGLAIVLRWFWWRISAITEIVALIVSVSCAIGLNMAGWPHEGSEAHRSALRLLVVVAISAVVSLAATFMTKAETPANLIEFYKRVNPPGWWGPVAQAAGGKVPSGFGWPTVGQIALSLIFIFACMIGLGEVMLGEVVPGAIAIVVGVAAGAAALRWVFRTQPA